MEFKLNGLNWTVEMASDDVDVLSDEKTCMGLTDYYEQTIWIRPRMTYANTRRTVIHELVHCFRWCYGLYNSDMNDEQVCRFCEAYLDGIKELADQIMEEFYEQQLQETCHGNTRRKEVGRAEDAGGHSGKKYRCRFKGPGAVETVSSFGEAIQGDYSGN